MEEEVTRFSHRFDDSNLPDDDAAWWVFLPLGIIFAGVLVTAVTLWWREIPAVLVWLVVVTGLGFFVGWIKEGLRGE